MDLIGLLNDILVGTTNIDKGRKNLATNGLEHEGRLLYEDGISLALTIFNNINLSADPKLMVVIEKTFLQQELQFCDDTDTSTRSSLTKAIQDFDDALRCLKTAEDNILYKAVETAFPTSSTKYRKNGLPRDAVHVACDAHWTRLQNILRVPGINMIEKAVLEQRAVNMRAIQAAYSDMQKAALDA
jgi:hypothetical protein